MITCIIVDDEEGGRLTLRNLIKEHLPELAVAAEASNVETAYTAIVRHKPDLIFLDIQLSGEIGFQLLEKFDQLDFQVIFITAYDKYALKAIKFAALDYLIKPVDIEELKQAVKKAGKIIGEARRNRNLEVFVQNMKHKEFASRKVALPILNGYTFVQVNDIIRCAGEASYSIVFQIKTRS
jgi:two-component system, LytTR family, response regulator